MRRALILGVIVVAGVTVAVVGQAQQGAPPPAQLRIEPVKPGLFAILNPGANTLAVRVTNDGVLLVDDMFEPNYDQIIALVKTVTPQPVKYVVSTHHHPDHTGGNVRFLQHATIVGHKNARAAMTRGPKPMPGPPPVTFANEAAIHLGGAEVQMHYLGPGHTNGDIVVYFPDLRVIATGDLYVVLGRVPYVDYASGGTTIGWLPTLDNILKFDFDTVIPGHGPVSTKAAVQKYRENLQTVHTRTRELIKQGVSKDQYLSKLKTDDLGWSLDQASLFVRAGSGGFYDELQASVK
jgi:glyoxylase-like metal-dependent hydrolase (beta-lactamase superfamily II)